MSSTALDPPAPEGRSASVPRAAFTRPPTRSNTFPSPEIPKAARPVKHATFAADLEQPPPTAASAPPGNIPPNNRNGGAPPMYPPPPPSGPPQQSPSPPKPLAGGIIEVEAYKRQILSNSRTLFPGLNLDVITVQANKSKWAWHAILVAGYTTYVTREKEEGHKVFNLCWYSSNQGRLGAMQGLLEFTERELWNLMKDQHWDEELEAT